MKSKGKVIVPIVLAAAVLVITGVLIYQHPLPGMEGWFPQQAPTGQPAVSQQEESGGGLTSVPSQQIVPDPNLPEEIDTFQLDPEKVYQIGETFQTADMEGLYKVTINNAKMSKDLQGHKKELYYYAPEHPLLSTWPDNVEVVDEGGNYISPHSYLFVTLTIENLQNKEVEPCVGNIQLRQIGSDNKEIYTIVNEKNEEHYTDLDAYPHYIENNDPNDDLRYFIKLKPNEKKKMDLGYTVYDNGLSDDAHLYLQFNLAGTGVGDNESTLYYFPVVDLELP